jgi:hypothetical protein
LKTSTAKTLPSNGNWPKPSPGRIPVESLHAQHAARFHPTSGHIRLISVPFSFFPIHL